ncbi:MAG TPA: peptidylprolyl isomerase [Burkholderiales bacterium]|nr:peptidylprolyl isomerase [Burkholderiales bacterium]
MVVGLVRSLGVVALLAPCFLSTVAAAPGRPIEQLDRIVAVVNEDVITDTELATRTVQLKRQLTVEKIKLPPDDTLRRQLLERMIMERLQLQIAERVGIRVGDGDVERTIENIARNNKLSPADFQKTLEREGLDPKAHAAEIRTQLVIRQLVDREINGKINVSESEIATFLEANPQGSDVEYNVSHIFMPLPESASPETIQAARKRAEDVHGQIKGGASFEQSAVSHSQGEGALSGGSLGWKKTGQLPELFVDTLKNLGKGAVSDVLRGPNGFHILKLNDRRGGSAQAAVTQTRARHILLRRSEVQSLDEARAKLASLRERIAHGDDFAALARAHSEDSVSAGAGGDLGWVTPGQLVPEFERAMDGLKPGELSQPIRSPYGLHLIQVLERRTQDMSEDRQQTAARQQIHSRKANERYEQWVRQLRDEAYVEYLIEDVN